MPWKDKLRRIKSGLGGRKDTAPASALALPPQQQAAAGGTDTNLSGQPVFQADTPVAADWETKIGHGENGWGNAELQYYTDSPENVFYTDDGHLVVRAIVDSAAEDADRRHTSARLVSRAPLGRDRGVLTGLVQSPCAEGVWPAFWLLPQEPFAWPADGEIDIAETWNGDGQNHSCLHWGFHDREPQKHRVQATALPDMHARPVRYDFAWDQTGGGQGGPGGQGGQGRLIWYIDGRPVLKAAVPPGTRPLRDFCVLLNVALGGNVCAGKVPRDGHYDLVVHALFLASEQENGGWAQFDRDWNSSRTPEGSAY